MAQLLIQESYSFAARRTIATDTRVHVIITVMHIDLVQICWTNAFLLYKYHAVNPGRRILRRKLSLISMSFRTTKQSVKWNSRLSQHTLPPSSETMATIDLIRYQRHCFLGNSKPPYHPYLQNVQKCFKSFKYDYSMKINTQYMFIMTVWY